MGIRVNYFSQANVSLEQIADLIRSSFVERKEQRLNMDGCFITSEKIKDVIDGGNDIVLAFDNESNELVGADIVEVKSYRGGYYLYNWITAVCPRSKGKHVASIMMDEVKNYAMKNHCDYIWSCTATNATSSVKFHLKNGFRIYGFTSDRTKNYYSYLFRDQIAKSCFWNNSLFYKISFAYYYLRTKILRKEDGSQTMVGRFADLITFHKIRSLNRL